MKRQILVLAHRVPYPPNKGEKLRTFHQIKHFVNEGSEVTVCCPLADDTDLKDLKALEVELGVNTIARKNNLRHLRLLGGLIKFKPLSVSNFHVPDLQQALDRHLLNGKVDSILCTSSCMAEYVFQSKSPLLEHNEKPRLVMDFMDLDSEKWHQYIELRGFLRSLIYRREALLLRSYECRIHNSFDACVFVSSQEVAMLEANLGRSSTKLHAIGNGIDPEEFYPPSEPRNQDDIHLLFVGVMDYFPNEDAMVWFVKDMWPSIHKRFPNAKLSIVGMRPSRPVAELSSFAGVTVVGFVDDVLPWFYSASLFIAPFRVARGIQNKILQAMATNVPVVSTTLGAEGITTGDVELLHIADNTKEFIKLVITLLTSPDESNRYCTNAVSFVHNQCSWHTLNIKLHSLLRM